MSYTCALTGLPINHGETMLLSFILPATFTQSDDHFISISDSNVKNAIERVKYKDNSIYYSFSDFFKTKIAFDVKNLTDDFQLIETDENIKNLKNVITLLAHDYFCNVNIEGSSTYKTLFSSEKLNDLFDSGNYTECFSYIVKNIDSIYIVYDNRHTKLHYNVISYKTIQYVTTDEFTTNYYGFAFSELDNLMNDLIVNDEYLDPILFEDDNILNQFENVIPMFTYDRNIESFDDFKFVYPKHCLLSYLELLFKDTRTKLSPSYTKENLDFSLPFNFKLDLLNGVAESVERDN